MKYPTLLVAALALAACGDNSQGSPDGKPADKAAAPVAAAKPETKPEAPATPEERGKKLFKECAVCHTVKQGDGNRVGPNLFGVVGRAAGSLEGFAYTKAMKESGIVWDDETLDGYLENPPQYVRGNRMAYVGQRDPQKRADLIAYLKTLK